MNSDGSIGNSRLYNLDAAREPSQREYMAELEADGICLFCPEILLSDDSQEILYVTASWVIAKNRFPYAGTKGHFLLIPKDHILRVVDLTAPARKGFWNALEWLVAEYDLADYGIGMRNGDPKVTRATIAHAHVHVLVPDGSAAVRMRLG